MDAEESFMKCLSLKRTSIGAILNKCSLCAQQITQSNSLRERLLSHRSRHKGDAIQQPNLENSTSYSLNEQNSPSYIIHNGVNLLDHMRTWVEDQNILERLERDIYNLMDEYQRILDFEFYPLEYEMRRYLFIQADIHLRILQLVNAEETHRVNDSLEERDEWMELELELNKSLQRTKERELMEIFIFDAKLDKEEMFNEELDTMTAIKFNEEGDREDLMQYLANRDAVTFSRPNTAYFSPSPTLSQQPPRQYPQGIVTGNSTDHRHSRIPPRHHADMYGDVYQGMPNSMSYNTMGHTPTYYNGTSLPPRHPADMGGVYQNVPNTYATSSLVPPQFADSNVNRNARRGYFKP